MAVSRRTCQRCNSEENVTVTGYKYIEKSTWGYDSGKRQYYRFYYKCSCGKKFVRDFDCTRY